MQRDIIDKTGFAVMAVTWVACWIYYCNYSNELFYSFMAAGLTAVFAWIGYIALRVLYLSFRK